MTAPVLSIATMSFGISFKIPRRGTVSTPLLMCGVTDGPLKMIRSPAFDPVAACDSVTLVAVGLAVTKVPGGMSAAMTSQPIPIEDRGEPDAKTSVSSVVLVCVDPVARMPVGPKAPTPASPPTVARCASSVIVIAMAAMSACDNDGCHDDRHRSAVVVVVPKVRRAI